MIYKKQYIYAIILPFIASFIFALFIKIILPDFAIKISNGINKRVDIFLIVTGALIAVSGIFTQKIFFEDNSIVLSVTTGVIRNVYLTSLGIHLLLSITCMLLVLLFSIYNKSISNSFPNIYLGFLYLLECYFMIQNGLDYSRMREKIIVVANQSLQLTRSDRPRS